MARILLVAGDATESLDTWYPYHLLREEGIEVPAKWPWCGVVLTSSK